MFTFITDMFTFMTILIMTSFVTIKMTIEMLFISALPDNDDCYMLTMMTVMLTQNTVILTMMTIFLRVHECYVDVEDYYADIDFFLITIFIAIRNYDFNVKRASKQVKSAVFLSFVI